jgi:hypothetical protein
LGFAIAGPAKGSEAWSDVNATPHRMARIEDLGFLMS